MITGLTAGILWGLDTVILGIALAMTPFVSTEQGPPITTIFSTGCAACSVCRLSIILSPPFPTETPLRRAALYIQFAVLLPCFFAFMDCFSFYSHPKALSIFFCPSPLQQPHRSGSFSGFRYKTLRSTTGSVDSTAYPLH